MDGSVNIFAPNLNILFETYDNRVDSPVLPDADEDDYLSALLQLGILAKSDSLYEMTDEWGLMRLSGSRLAKAFRRKMLEMPIVSDIIRSIGNDGKAADEVTEALAGCYPKETIVTFLSWAETIGLLQLNNKKYYNSDEAEDEDDDDWNDYPSLDDVVSIKDDKYSVFEYIRRLNSGNIILSPDFQRNEVWKLEQKSKFIESVLRGLPLPPIYVKKDSDGRYIVVDGLQRTSTLRDFMSGKLRLSGLEPEHKNVLNGATIDTLEDIRSGLRARMEDRQLFVYVMESSVPMSVVYDVFSRINTGGTQLSRQEIRNCVFQGRSTRLLKEIADSRDFKVSIGNGIQDLRMKDREAVLRCLSFVVLNYELDYDGSMDKFLEKAMSRINKMSDDETDMLKMHALNVYSLTYRLFGDGNFRIPTDCTRGRINIAVMESLFHCFYWKQNEVASGLPDQSQLSVAFADLLKNKDYLDSVRWATGSTTKVKTRFRLAHNSFDTLLSV